MTTHQHNYYFYVGIITLAIVSFLWAEFLQQNVEGVTQLAPAHSADYFSVGYQKWQMDDKGEREMQLNANKMTHYSDNKTIQLASPVMIVENAQHLAPWRIEAQSGEVITNLDVVLLHGQVLITRPAHNTVREVEIKTAEVSVTPRTHFAQTAQWSQLRSGKNITTGVGMKTTFSSPIHIELLSKVHSHYETK